MVKISEPSEPTLKLLLEDIQEAIAKLKAEYRDPFMMHFNGFKYHEIAEELAIPIGTVKNRIHIARKHLKSDLDVYRDGK